MNKKLLLIGATVVVVSFAAYFISIGNKKAADTEKNTSQEQTTQKAQNRQVGECIPGTKKTVAGIEYIISEKVTYMINGKSYDLCCWETGEEKRKRKVCSDSVTSPVGYDNGVLFENDDISGEYIKTMETYREGNKVCQQHYESSGTAGALNCKDRLN